MALSLASRSLVEAAVLALGVLVGDFAGEDDDVEETAGSSSRIRCEEA